MHQQQQPLPSPVQAQQNTMRQHQYLMQELQEQQMARHSDQLLRLQQQQQQLQQQQRSSHQQISTPPSGINLQGVVQDNALTGVYPSNTVMIQNKLTNLSASNASHQQQPPPQFMNNPFDPRPIADTNLEASPQPHPDDQFQPSERVVPFGGTGVRGSSSTTNSNSKAPSLKLPPGGRRGDMKREGSEQSLQVDSVFSAGSKGLDLGGNNKGMLGQLPGGDSSAMSLSIGDMGVVPEHSHPEESGGGAGDPLSLGQLTSLRNNTSSSKYKTAASLESSVMSLASLSIDDVGAESTSQQNADPSASSSKASRSHRRELRRLNSKDSIDPTSISKSSSDGNNSDLGQVMDMSMNTLGGVMSDFGDMSLAKIGTESFSNFFEETDRDLFVNNR